MYTKTITLPNGKRKYIRATTKEALEKKYIEAKLAIGAGVDILDSTTVAEYIEIWYSTFKEGNLAPASQVTERHAMEKIADSIGALKLKDVKPLHIQRLFQSLSEYSKSYNNKVLSVLKQVFNTAADNGLILKSPVVSSIKAGGEPTKEKEPLTPEQSERLLNMLDGDMRLFAHIALKTGLRRGEIFGLQWTDISNGYLTVNRSIVPMPTGCIINNDLKTDAARRTIPLTYQLEAELNAIPRTSLWVFPGGQGYCTRSEMERPNIALTAAGKELGCHITPHILRHTCITRWFEIGLDLKEVQYLAGHTRVDMTLAVYTHYCRESRAAETAEKLREHG